MNILVINAGSSTWKFSLFDGGAERELMHDIAPASDGADGAIAHVLERVPVLDKSRTDEAEKIEIVGHRVVHGGTRFHEPTVIDDAVIHELQGLTELAPLHNPPALAAIAAARRALPRATHVAVFDTAYFVDLPPQAYIYPVPYAWHTDWGIRRFGFHGISHAYCAARAAELLGRDPQELRLVICHLGSGASATAVHAGKPVATTMGFTPMEGLMMGTRCGSIDPGLLLYVLRHRGLNVDQLDDILNHQSGLQGVSGIDSDMRNLEAAADAGNDRARLAISIFCNSVRSAVGSLAVTLGGIDGLVFTAGIGEHSPAVRRAVCNGLQCLGLRLDESRSLAPAIRILPPLIPPAGS